MASSIKSAIEPGASSSNVSPTPKTISNPSPILSQNEELGHQPVQGFYAGGHYMPPMAYNGNGPYTITAQPSYYPPPPPNYPTYNNYPASKEKHIPAPLCRIVVFFFSLLVVITISFSILRTIYKPKDPSISITSANLTALTLFNSSTIMSFSLTLTFLFHNPNKRMSISYEGGMEVDVLYHQEFVRSDQPEFGQDAESDKVIEAEVVKMDSRILASTIQGINEDLVKTGEVEFAVELEGDMSFDRALGFLIKPLKAFCPSVKIRFVNGTKNGGTLAGPSTICQVVM